MSGPPSRCTDALRPSFCRRRSGVARGDHRGIVRPGCSARAGRSRRRTRTWRRGEREKPGRGDANPTSREVTDRRYELVIAPTARRQLTEQLPESIAFAAYEFIVGPLPDNPHRVGKRLRTPLNDRHSAAVAPIVCCTESTMSTGALPSSVYSAARTPTAPANSAAQALSRPCSWHVSGCRACDRP